MLKLEIEPAGQSDANMLGLAVQNPKARVNHLGAEEALADFAEGAHASLGRERVFLVRVEIDEAQAQLAARIADAAQQLPARPVHDSGVKDRAFDLYRDARIRRLLDLDR